MFKKWVCSDREPCEQEVHVLIFRFDEKESISGIQQLKSSVQKGIRNKLIEQYPHIETHIDQILPKKDQFRVAKW